MDKEKQAKIDELLTIASNALQEAKELAGTSGSFYWDGPAYGMGGWIESGEWMASSHSC